MTQDNSDRREYDRSPVELEVSVTVADGRRVAGSTADVGMGGFSLECAEPLPIGTCCHAQMRLDMGHKAIEMETDGQVVWTADRHMGVAFIGTDPENYEKIRNLFLYNPTGAGWD